MQLISRRRLANYIASELANGADVQPLLKQVASYLVDHRQTGRADLLVRDIEATLASDYGVVLAKVISARELSDGLINNIEQFVSLAQGAKQVEISASVDPSLLGGVIIRTPSFEMDTSVRKRLNELRA